VLCKHRRKRACDNISKLSDGYQPSAPTTSADQADLPFLIRPDGTHCGSPPVVIKLITCLTYTVLLTPLPSPDADNPAARTEPAAPLPRR